MPQALNGAGEPGGKLKDVHKTISSVAYFKFSI